MPRVRGAQEFTLPEGATLKQLVEKGLSMSHAGVGTVVRLRKELSLIKDIPVLIAIDDVSLTQPQDFLLVISSSIMRTTFLFSKDLTSLCFLVLTCSIIVGLFSASMVCEPRNPSMLQNWQW